jgi:hypothetical protein
MAEPQLSVRSAKARDLARRLARRENRSIADVVERALEAYEIREAGRERHPFSTRALRTTMAPISIWRSSFAKTGRSIQDRSFDLPLDTNVISETLRKAPNPAVIA